MRGMAVRVDWYRLEGLGVLKQYFIVMFLDATALRLIICRSFDFIAVKSRIESE
jgi:hypothetical protein